MEQHNTATDGGTAISTQTGDVNISFQQAVKDYFNNGMTALGRQLYPSALQHFLAFLSSAQHATGEKNRPMIAVAHVCAALAIMHGNPPHYLKPEEVKLVLNHLKEARKIHDNRSVEAMAGTVMAIVKEDYYLADGMRAPEEQPEQLRGEVALLEQREVVELARHLGLSRGTTWQLFADRAAEFGELVARTDRVIIDRDLSPERAEAVRKYFRKTPDPKSLFWPITCGIAALVLLVVGLRFNWFALVVCLFLIFRIGRFGFRKLGEYRQFRKEWEWAEPKPSDEQMDLWLREDVEFIRNEAGPKLRINPRLDWEGGELVVESQAVVGVPDSLRGKPVYYRLGEDYQLRASAYDVAILLLTDRSINSYRCHLDTVSGDIVVELQEEYHYRDIVGVLSRSQPVSQVDAEAFQKTMQLPEGWSLNITADRIFELRIKNGAPMELHVGYGTELQDEHGNVAWSGNTHAPNVIQKMWRARRS
ncbi:hypothetical protein D5S17_05340 [Pseudonocardiaceae bacterium YIM PH 21723]|nr:hypothetical protein D5S17_05340 [Pseudonocardiaceae bacterium YIM PH 21723]